MERLDEYREAAFSYLNTKVQYFNDNVDEYLDTALRNVSQLPLKPKDHDNYNGILGMKPVIEQRKLCLKLLKDRIAKSDELIRADYHIDTAIRLLNSLASRPKNREAYEGLFILEEEKKVNTDFNNINSYTVSKKGIELIHSFESYRACTYKDPGSRSGLPITGGYGTTRLNGRALKLGQCFSKEIWDKAFKDDLKTFEDAVKKYVKVPITEEMFSALTSWTYNCGISNLINSTGLKRLNKGNYKAAWEAFSWYNKGANGKVLAGLVRRRKAEGELFFS